MKKITFLLLSFIISLATVNAKNGYTNRTFSSQGKQPIHSAIDTPTIVAGTAKITGRIIIPANTNKNNISVNITISQPISGDYVKQKAIVDQSGQFSFNVDIETDIALIGLYTSLDREKVLLVKLKNGAVTHIDITYHSNFDIKNIAVTPIMTKNDITDSFELINQMIMHRGDRAPQALYNKSTDVFLNYAKTILSERLAIVNNNTSVSKELREMLAKDFHLWLYNVHVFSYKGAMLQNYRNVTRDENENPDIQEIDSSYFRFLKDFNFNDPQYLQCFTFQEVQKTILQNEILALPEIGESDVPSWLARVKGTLSDLVGFNSGQYYDILAANAYARQLTEEVKPLSDKQKEQISKYWRNGEIAKILFRKNQKVVELNRLKSPLVVNDIASVPVDKVMEAILAKHKGKVVFIDLWATWCVPCLNAMDEFRSTKNELKDKDITFVYLTNGSSPKKLWEEKIKGIGDQHYYLTAAQWEYVMDHFGFEAIPSYLLFNKEGKLVNQFTAFPGNVKVKDMITGLL